MKKIFFLAAAALALASCDKNDDNTVTSPTAAQISATIGGNNSTRASDTQWAAGDNIGITATAMGDKKPHINMKYTTLDGGAGFTGNPIYFYKPMSFTAYYPFTGAEGTAPGTIAATTRTASQAPGEQPKIDFLYASTSEISIVDNEPKIHFTFAHKMSKLTLTFINGEGADVSKISSYSIEGLVLEGTFNTETGDCAAKSGVDAESLSIYPTEVESGVAVAPLILFPQTTAGKTVTLKITDSENQAYSCELKFKDNELASGNNYQFTIKVGKAVLEIGQTGIEDWNTIVGDEIINAF